MVEWAKATLGAGLLLFGTVLTPGIPDGEVVGGYLLLDAFGAFK